MQMYDTDRERGVDVKHDWFVTNASLESRGVRVILHSDGRKTCMSTWRDENEIDPSL